MIEPTTVVDTLPSPDTPRFKTLAPVFRAVTYLHPGTRRVQEDALEVDALQGLAIVADGFGCGGGQAAALACKSTREFLSKQGGDLEATLPFIIRPYFSLAANVLYNAILYANQKLNGRNAPEKPPAQGGASICALFLDGATGVLASVGGCQALLLRGGQVREIIQPRTLARYHDPFLSLTGKPSSLDPASGNPEHLQIPLRALGMNEELDPEIVEFRVQAGDLLFLASDGLTHGHLTPLVAQAAGPAARDASTGSAPPADVSTQHTEASTWEADYLRIFQGLSFSDNVAAIVLEVRQ